MARDGVLMRVAVGHRRIDEVAGRIPVACLADVLQEFIVAIAPVETEGLFQALRRAAGGAGRTAARVVDQAPDIEALGALVVAQDTPPVDQDAHALLEDVAVKTVVAGRGLVPDLPPGAFRWGEIVGAGVEARIAVGRWRYTGVQRSGREGHQQCRE